MNLEFSIFKLKEGSKSYQQLIKSDEDKNEFVIVGEDAELNCLKVQQLGEKGIMVIGGLNIDECSLLVYKEDLTACFDGISSSICEIDIPKKYLTVDIIDNIKRLNS
jgi:hypothetical protein